MQSIKRIACLTFMIVVMSVLGTVSMADDNIAGAGWYKPPCVSCGYVTPTPTPVYERINIGFNTGSTTLKSGQKTTLTAYQISGTPLISPNWGWVIQPSSGVGYSAYGQTVQITVRSFGKWNIVLSVSDSLQPTLIGSTSSKVTFIEKR